MISPSPFDAMIQSIAALMIFVIGYFVLLLSLIVCLLIAALISKVARLLWYYSIRSIAPADHAPGPVTGGVHLVSRRIDTMGRPVAPAQRSGSGNMIRVNSEL